MACRGNRAHFQARKQRDMGCTLQSGLQYNCAYPEIQKKKITYRGILEI